MVNGHVTVISAHADTLLLISLHHTLQRDGGNEERERSSCWVSAEFLSSPLVTPKNFVNFIFYSQVAKDNFPTFLKMSRN